MKYLNGELVKNNECWDNGCIMDIVVSVCVWYDEYWGNVCGMDIEVGVCVW